MKTIVIEEEANPPTEKYPNCYAGIPPNGETCQHTGLKHAKFYTMLPDLVGKVRIVNLREEGASRGKTLFHVGDMLRHLDQLAAVQASKKNLQRGDNHPQEAR